MKISDNYDLLTDFRENFPSYFVLEEKPSSGFFEVMKKR